MLEFVETKSGLLKFIRILLANVMFLFPIR